MNNCELALLDPDANELSYEGYKRAVLDLNEFMRLGHNQNEIVFPAPPEGSSYRAQVQMLGLYIDGKLENQFDLDRKQTICEGMTLRLAPGALT